MSTKGREAFAALVKAKPNFLAMPIEELVELRGIGDGYVKWRRDVAKKMKRGEVGTQLAEREKKAILGDGQSAGKALCEIEIRIGELLPSPEASLLEARKMGPKVRDGIIGKRDPKVRQREIDARKRARAMKKAKASGVYKRAVKEAEKNEDIVTPSFVVAKAKAEREEKLRKKYQAEVKEKNAKEEAQHKVLQGHAFQYASKLREVLYVLQALPSKPPSSGWTAASLAGVKATGKAISEMAAKKLGVLICEEESERSSISPKSTRR